jgi:hypothetical protein
MKNDLNLILIICLAVSQIIMYVNINKLKKENTELKFQAVLHNCATFKNSKLTEIEWDESQILSK